MRISMKRQLRKNELVQYIALGLQEYYGESIKSDEISKTSKGINKSNKYWEDYDKSRAYWEKIETEAKFISPFDYHHFLIALNSASIANKCEIINAIINSILNSINTSIQYAEENELTVDEDFLKFEKLLAEYKENTNAKILFKNLGYHMLADVA